MVGVTSEWMSVVIIMSVGGQYENDYLIVVHLVDKAVFLGYAARPLSGAVARQAVGVAGAGGGIADKFIKQLYGFVE